MKTIITGIIAAMLILAGFTPDKAAASDRLSAGTIIGAATGAWVGSNIGKGDGRIVAIAAGTLLGAVIGTDISRQPVATARPTQQVYVSDNQRKKRLKSGPRKHRRVARHNRRHHDHHRARYRN
jgi:outer membrane lipoprotein SlyB